MFHDVHSLLEVVEEAGTDGSPRVRFLCARVPSILLTKSDSVTPSPCAIFFSSVRKGSVRTDAGLVGINDDRTV